MQTVGVKCELRTWQEKFKKDGNRVVVLKDENDEEPDDEEYAIVAREILNDRHQLDQVIVKINSPHILSVFREVVKSYPTVPYDFTSPFEMESPFAMLYHFWDEFDDYRQSEVADDTTRMHLNLLFEFMNRELGPDRSRCNAMVKKGEITFSKLWTLFRPGELQYAVQNGHAWVLKLERTAYDETKQLGKFLKVYCSYTDYNGKHFGQASHMFRIREKEFFPAETPGRISGLPAFPWKLVEDRDSIELRLVKRGIRFLELHGIVVKRYDGLAQYLKEPPYDFYDPDMSDWGGVWLPYTETGRVVLDRKTFQEEQYGERVEIIPYPTEGNSEQALHEQRLLCPPGVMGYSLARKDWCQFYVDNIQDIKWNRKAFDTLILKEDPKRILRALVSSHSFQGDVRDESQQKGKGLVVLLYGEPGSGKTLTAESAAEITERALLTSSMGELNKAVSPYYFEFRLKKLLQYATIWKAVVLLDEADVFLESREEGLGDQAERNALVAVFLRHLEYFSGIVFLTSNRVDVFDRAMKSRIHIALEYSSPGLEMRRLIWIQCLNNVSKSERNLDPDDAVDFLVREELNGREIANAVTTARTLARFEGKPLALHHIETVLQVRTDFESSIKRLGNEDSQQGKIMPLLRKNSLIK